jgi:transposase
MGRPVDPLTPRRVKPHVVGAYIYASTQPSFVDSETGKSISRHVHWGKVEDGVRFIPGENFYLASPEERANLIFPENWDLSEAEKLTGLRHAGRPVCDHQCRNSLYGDIWLLEQVAIKTGIRQDLNSVFMGNSELVDDLLTLAMFPYLTGWTFNRLARWQENVKAPSSRALTPSVITRLTQSITERHRMELLKLRAARVGKDELCAVDSTTRSAYGHRLADIQPGRNKDHLPLEQTTEVVVYTLSNHMPIYYRTFPGNIPDSRTLDVICTDLDHAGFKNLILITDRGYDTLRNVEKYISRGQRMIMCVKTNQREALKVIEELGEVKGRPKTMEIDYDAGHYFKMFDVDYQIEGTGKSVKQANRLRLHLYFDSVRRARELFQLDLELSEQAEVLGKLLETGGTLEDIVAARRDNRFYKLFLDNATGKLKSFERDERKVAKAERLSGFFSIMTHKLDFDSKRTFESYRLRDEQEKCFQQMKSQMVSDRQRNWSEAGKTGRLFILFVSLILGSHVRHVWSSTRLRSAFSSSLEMVDAMRPIRCIEHTNRAKKITPFVGAQLEICENFGFAIPEGCAPVNTSRRVPKRKRGRPRKNQLN